MSATPNNAGVGWDDARTLTPAPARDSREADGRNALQGLLAFACIHQQAARRKREALNNSSDLSPRFSREEEFALDEILQLVAARAIAMTGADGIAIALAKDRAIVCRACAGKIAPDPGAKLDPNAGFSGACLRSGEIVRCDDSENDPRVNPAGVPCTGCAINDRSASLSQATGDWAARSVLRRNLRLQRQRREKPEFTRRVDSFSHSPGRRASPCGNGA